MTRSQFSTLLIIYGLGFAAVYFAMTLLYLHAYRSSANCRRRIRRSDAVAAVVSAARSAIRDANLLDLELSTKASKLMQTARIGTAIQTPMNL